MSEQFDFESFSKSAIEKLKQGKPLTGADGVFTPLLKMILEASLESEITDHVQETKSEKNRRNGKAKKTITSGLGSFELETPRDRNGSFEPQTVPKRQVSISSDIDKKIIGLYGLGMSYSDIQNHLKEMYDFEVSDGTISSITDRILPEIKEWQNRPLESVYPLIWLDAMHYKVRDEGQVKSKAIYSILGVTIEGQKEVLGIYFGNSESSSFWRQVLNDLQNRGLEDVFIACIDNLSGFGDAIEDYYPKTEVQLCLVHQMRNSAKYVTHTDLREVMKDLKVVYQAPSEQKGLEALELAREKWNKKYPAIFRSWDKNWDRLANIYKYSPHLKRLMYTTNPIESYHRMIRKVTKTKGAFSSENAILKQVYLAIMNAQTRWNGQIFHWSAIQNDLNAYFSDRIK
ncbi:IS256 family transposase [Flavobacterium filum]|uniref:IS256 family transposase n=4 Tax=Flavobacterium filum TaxID=370974 RepID=UPI0003F90EDE|nr:IS256 family transposase [Flavobacterium filum]